MPLDTKSMPATLQCPSCNNSIPGWATQCQFCGAPIAGNVQRPANAYQYRIDTRKDWKDIMATILACVWIAWGGLLLAQAARILPSWEAAFGGATFLAILGCIAVLMGLGLLFQMEVIEYLAKMVCILIVILAAWGLFVALIYIWGKAKVNPMDVVWNVFQLALAGMQVYILNSTTDA